MNNPLPPAPGIRRGAPPDASVVIVVRPRELTCIEDGTGGCVVIATSPAGVQVSIPLSLPDRVALTNMLRGQVPPGAH